ncbi:MAG: hypothetical protein ACPIOQ_21935 [Promethearchaeia archaeon]
MFAAVRVGVPARACAETKCVEPNQGPSINGRVRAVPAMTVEAEASSGRSDDESSSDSHLDSAAPCPLAVG